VETNKTENVEVNLMSRISFELILFGKSKEIGDNF